MNLITDAEVSRHLLKYRAPIVTAKGTFTERPTVILTIKDSDGSTGVGEACPMVGFADETIDETEKAIWDWLHTEDQNSPPLIPTARAAIEGALFDLKAKQQEKYLCHYLNPESSLKVPVSILVNGETPSELTANVKQIVDDGFSSLKLKIGARSFNEDLSRINAMREVANSNISIRLDANGAWSVSEAIANVNQLQDLSIEFIEEPVSGIEQLREVRNACGVPIAADETALNIEAVETLIEREAVDCIIVKPSAIGGIVPSTQVTDLARASGIDVVVTSLLESSIGVSLAAHFASALQLTDPAPGLATSYLLLNDLIPAPEIKDGCIHLS